MQQEILINHAPQETRVAVIEDGAVQELLLERALERGLVGNIYLGQVVRVLPGIQSAFVNIGLERTAFLHVADLRRVHAGQTRDRNGDTTARPIEKQISEGQRLLVQVIKDPIGSKGARLTTDVSLAGRLLVYLPADAHMGISQRIDAALREPLRQRLTQLARQDEAAEPSDGFILRTNAETASDAQLLDDMQYLRKIWQHIRLASMRQSPASLLHADLDLSLRVLRDLVNGNTQSVQIDSGEQFARLQAFGQEYMPRVVEKLQRYRGERPIFERFNVDEEVERALHRRVDLKSGGYLVVDQTEALTTFDVNTGGYVGVRSFDDTVYRTNLEAAHAVARQLRLRNLGGIIVVDFIDMSLPEHRDSVLAALCKQLQRDRVKTRVNGFSALGLVEMTRERTRESLTHRLCQVCPQCQGSGQIRTVRTIVYDILREILREAKQFSPMEFRVVAAPEIIDAMLDDESAYLSGLSDFIGKEISLKADASLPSNQYDIVLL